MWSEQQVEQLKSLCAAGKTFKQIAQALGVTRNQVGGKIFRMGLRPGGEISFDLKRARTLHRNEYDRKKNRCESVPRAHHVVRQAKKPSEPKKQRTRNTPFRRPPSIETSVEIARMPPKAEPLPINPPSTAGNALLALSSNGCRWPHGDPQGKAFQYCGHQAEIGKPYCHFHARRAYETRAQNKQRRDEARSVYENVNPATRRAMRQGARP
ncbi:MAG TPA: GcrA family cell cycle regulator [Pseudolabrys sp.]|nr:GcrA family cell cycle regulator [Pseudolabrys sp.]